MCLPETPVFATARIGLFRPTGLTPSFALMTARKLWLTINKAVHVLC